MAWVRLDDGAMTHPKIVGLSDKAFRLWVWGLAYCQAHLTDGSIPDAAVMKTMRRTADELVGVGLWHGRDIGWMVHDYLDWNDSREIVRKRQTEAKERMATARGRRSQNVRTNASERTSPEVPLRLGSSSGSFPERESEGKPSLEDQIGLRAGRLREELYPEWYAKFRHGARLRLISNSLEHEEAKGLCRTWDDARLQKLAQIVLTTDDDWISRTDRGFKIFVLKASWADSRLADAEALHKTPNAKAAS